MAENKRLLDVVTFIERELSPLRYGNLKRREESDREGAVDGCA